MRDVCFDIDYYDDDDIAVTRYADNIIRHDTTIIAVKCRRVRYIPRRYTANTSFIDFAMLLRRCHDAAAAIITPRYEREYARCCASGADARAARVDMSQAIAFMLASPRWPLLRHDAAAIFAAAILMRHELMPPLHY